MNRSSLSHILRICLLIMCCFTLPACSLPPGPVATSGQPTPLPSKAASTTQATPMPQVSATPLATTAPVELGSIQVKSIYNDNIPPSTAERIQINELELMRDALRLL